MMKTIPLTQNKVAIVDDEDYELVSQFKWFAQCNRGKGWYARRMVYLGGGRKARRVRNLGMHQLILATPEGCEIDHRDGNGLNNTRQNLRIATRAQNCRNRTLRTDNTSGFKGVHWKKQIRRWRAQIKVNGKLIWLCDSEDPVIAARAYDAKAREVHGEFAGLNFPDEQ